MDADRRKVLHLCGTVGVVGGLAGCLRLESQELDENGDDAGSGDGEAARAEQEEIADEEAGGRTDDGADGRGGEIADEDDRNDGDEENGDRPEDFLERFRAIVESETDIQIHSLRVEEAHVELDYDSEHALESQEGADEVIHIASSYARVASAGWRVDFLHAEFWDDDEEPYAFRVRTETALDWAAGRISDDEWHERILDNVRRR